MLVIGVSFVSFSKNRPPGDFQAWFASHSHLIGRLMIPLGVASIAISVAAVIACWFGPPGRRWWLLIAALSAIGVMATYPIFFAGTNETFLRGGLSEVRSLLQSLGNMALDSYGTWRCQLHRVVASPSGVMTSQFPPATSQARISRPVANSPRSEAIPRGRCSEVVWAGPVCTKNSHSNVVVMKSTEERK